MIQKVYYLDKVSKQTSKFELKYRFRGNNNVHATKQYFSFVRVENTLQKLWAWAQAVYWNAVSFNQRALRPLHSRSLKRGQDS